MVEKSTLYIDTYIDILDILCIIIYIVYITCTSGGRVDERRAVSCYTDVRSNCSKEHSMEE